jgi:hypothetical protein
MNFRGAMEIVKKDGRLLQHLDVKFRGNYQIVLEATKNHLCAINYATVELKDNTDIGIQIMKRDENNLKHLDYFADNYEFVMEAVKIFPWSLRYASRRLRNNYNIVKQACLKDTYVLAIASNELKDNYDFLLDLFESCNYVSGLMGYASDRLRDNYTLMMKSIKKHYHSFDFASKRLKNDYSILFEISKRDINLKHLNLNIEFSNFGSQLKMYVQNKSRGCLIKFLKPRANYYANFIQEFDGNIIFIFNDHNKNKRKINNF